MNVKKERSPHINTRISNRHWFTDNTVHLFDICLKRLKFNTNVNSLQLDGSRRGLVFNNKAVKCFCLDQFNKTNEGQNISANRAREQEKYN